MRKSFFNIAWFTSGLLLLFIGAILLVQTDFTIYTIGLLLGLVLLFTGISDLLCFIRYRHEMHGSTFILIDSLATILFPIFILMDKNRALVALCFSLWILISGLNKTIFAFELKSYHMNEWKMLFTLGIFEVILGLISVTRPFATLLTLSVVVSFSFLLYGIITILIGLFMKELFA